MRRPTAINLALLGGGLTLIGAAGVLNEHNRLVACEQRRGQKPPGQPDDCKSSPATAYGGHGGGGVYHGFSFGHGSYGIARGGFGGHGAGHGFGG
jgi:hypothetical protein